MGKSRVNIPKSIKEKVLNEFNHKCAICGCERPQVHHIDEDPSHNELENLIPLCPNHHLSDQHNPTSAVPNFQMSLFRKFKDPTVLQARFQPLYKRFIFLNEVENYKHKELVTMVKELINFISYLEMGGFYQNEIKKLISFNEIVALTWEGDREDIEYKIRYKDRLNTNKGRVIELIIELLRYQNWL